MARPRKTPAQVPKSPPAPVMNTPPPERTGNIVQRRPAEVTTPIAMILAMLIARLVGVEDNATVAYIAIVFSFVPTAVTWTVDTIANRGKV